MLHAWCWFQVFKHCSHVTFITLNLVIAVISYSSVLYGYQGVQVFPTVNTLTVEMIEMIVFIQQSQNICVFLHSECLKVLVSV